MSYGTRTLLELSVGRTHTIEVLIYLRKVDLEWWNRDSSKHQKELMKLIGRQILPTEVKDVIESHHCLKQKGELGRVIIGEKNLQKSLTKDSVNNLQESRKKRNRGSNTRNQNECEGAERSIKRKRLQHNFPGKNTKQKEKPSASKPPTFPSQTERIYASRLDIKYLFGETIQITYKIEEIQTSHTATLFYTKKMSPNLQNDQAHSHQIEAKKSKLTKNAFSSKEDIGKCKGLANFYQLKKLPKRVVLWCYPFDQSNPTEPIPRNGGFPRPEMIPLSSLFSERRTC